VRRVLAVVAVGAGMAALLVGVAPAATSSPRQVTRSVVITVRLIQEATYQHPHPPPIGLVLSTTLKLYAVGVVLGLPNNTYLGTMSFTYQLHGSCSAGGAGCTGTTNLQTLTTFPGGTITANGTNISLGVGLVVPVQKGTGAFKGVTGTIDIAPGGQASSVYRLTLPAG
jgi:hypothetical protein